MAGEFIPFLPAAQASGGSAPRPFAPVHSPAATVSGSNSGSTALPISASPERHRAVNIEMKREGDRVAQIRIQCRCGEIIELDCEY